MTLDNISPDISEEDPSDTAPKDGTAEKYLELKVSSFGPDNLTSYLRLGTAKRDGPDTPSGVDDKLAGLVTGFVIVVR